MRHIAAIVFILLFSMTLLGSSISPAPAVPANLLTTKGDLVGFSTDLVRIPVGTNGQFLSANSAQASGVEWVAGGGGADANAIYRNGSQPPTANQPWGGFDLLNARDLEATRDLYFGPSGSGKYKLTQMFGGSQLIGQTSGQGGFLSLFSKDGDATDSATYVVYAKGLPDFSTAAEYIQHGWISSESRFAIETGFFNPGSAAKPLTLRTAQGSGAANTDQLVLNTDGSITHGGAIGQQPYTFSRRTGALDRMTIQSQTPGLGFNLDVFAKDGDGTDKVGISTYHVGTPASVTNSESLFMGYDTVNDAFRLQSLATGTGGLNVIRVGVGTSNHDILTFNTDGSMGFRPISMTQTYKVTKNATTPAQLAFQGQSAATAATIGIFANDGDGTDNVGQLLYGVGTPTSATNTEFLEMNWSAANSRYQIVTNKAGTGTVRDFALGSLTHPTQLLLKTDGSFDHAPTGLQAYKVSRDSAARMTVQGQSVGTESSLGLFAKDSDGTDRVTMRTYAKGQPSGVDYEVMVMGWDTAASKFVVTTNFGGTGVARPLSLSAGISGVGTANQLLLNTDGTVSVGTTTGTINLGTGGSTLVGGIAGSDLKLSAGPEQPLVLRGGLPVAAGSGNVSIGAEDALAAGAAGNLEFFAGWSDSGVAGGIDMYSGGTASGDDTYGMQFWVGNGAGSQASALHLTGGASRHIETVKDIEMTDGHLKIVTAGKGIQIKSGANGMAGKITLVAGTKAVANTLVGANTICVATVQTLGTVTVPKAVQCAVTNGVGIDITSADATDTSVVAYTLIEAN